METVAYRELVEKFVACACGLYCHVELDERLYQVVGGQLVVDEDLVQAGSSWLHGGVAGEEQLNPTRYEVGIAHKTGPAADHHEDQSVQISEADFVHNHRGLDPERRRDTTVDVAQEQKRIE